MQEALREEERREKREDQNKPTHSALHRHVDLIFFSCHAHARFCLCAYFTFTQVYFYVYLNSRVSVDVCMHVQAVRALTSSGIKP